MTTEDLETAFKSEIGSPIYDFDPNCSLDPFSLTVGWVMGKGFSFDDAHTIALHLHYDIRYEKQYD